MMDNLEDETGELTRKWNREHDQHVLIGLLDSIAPEFQESTILAFRLLALDGKEPSAIAKELNISVASVYTAKSRTLRKLREVADGLGVEFDA